MVSFSVFEPRPASQKCFRQKEVQQLSPVPLFVAPLLTESWGEVGVECLDGRIGFLHPGQRRGQPRGGQEDRSSQKKSNSKKTFNNHVPSDQTTTFFFYLSHLFALFFSRPLPFRDSDPGWVTQQTLHPFRHYDPCLASYRENHSAFFSFADRRNIRPIITSSEARRQLTRRPKTWGPRLGWVKPEVRASRPQISANLLEPPQMPANLRDIFPVVSMPFTSAAQIGESYKKNTPARAPSEEAVLS